MKRTIVCLVIAAVFVYVSAMPADGDASTAAAAAVPAAPAAPPAPAAAAAPETPPTATTEPPAGEAAPEGPATPALTPSNPFVGLTQFVEKGMQDMVKMFGSFTG